MLVFTRLIDFIHTSDTPLYCTVILGCRPISLHEKRLYGLLDFMDLKTLAISATFLATSTLNSLGSFTVINDAKSPQEPARKTIECVRASKEYILNTISEVSKDFGVSETLLDFIVRRESQYNSCAVGDKDLPAPSLGLSQISMYYNPNITPEQAYNVNFSIEYLASLIRSGKASRWSTYRLFRDKYPNAPIFRPSSFKTPSSES